MSDLIGVLAPVFGLMAVGYFAVASGLIKERAAEGLSDFVFNLSVPALIFRTMATAALPDTQPWGYWGAYFLGTALVWLCVMQGLRRFFSVGARQSVIAGLISSQSNTVMVGIPVLLRAYGDPAAVPLFLLIAVHLPLMLSAATLMLEGGGGFDPLGLAKRLALNPILLSLFVGVAYRFSGLPLGGPPKAVIDALAAASLPCALTAMGMSLRRYGMRADIGLAGAITFFKLMVHPALVYVLAYRFFTMPPVWAGVAVLFAAMPCGVNSYLFAERYKTGVAMCSSAIAWSTALSLVSLFFWLWVLGVATP